MIDDAKTGYITKTEGHYRLEVTNYNCRPDRTPK